MVKDYASRFSRPSRHKKRGRLIWVTVVVIAAAILIPATMYTIHYRHALQQAKATMPKKTAAAKAVDTTTSTHNNKHRPRFDFYTLLPKMQVSVPKTATQSAAPKVAKHFGLQIASLQDATDAERVKNKLIALGYTANVQHYRNNNGTAWNRVWVGPYPSLDATQRVQAELQGQSIESIVLRLK